MNSSLVPGRGSYQEMLVYVGMGETGLVVYDDIFKVRDYLWGPHQVLLNFVGRLPYRDTVVIDWVALGTYRATRNGRVTILEGPEIEIYLDEQLGVARAEY